MAVAAHASELRAVFETHLQETRNQLRRLEMVRLFVDWPPAPSHAMRWLIEEADEIVDAEGDPAAIDAALIGAASRIEHYEVAGYGTARAVAITLGYDRVATLLGETLEEEVRSGRMLARLEAGEALEDGVGDEAA
jgi:ferritin-like metal-binding protein YciE